MSDQIFGAAVVSPPVLESSGNRLRHLGGSAGVGRENGYGLGVVIGLRALGNGRTILRGSADALHDLLAFGNRVGLSDNGRGAKSNGEHNAGGAEYHVSTPFLEKSDWIRRVSGQTRTALCYS